MCILSEYVFDSMSIRLPPKSVISNTVLHAQSFVCVALEEGVTSGSIILGSNRIGMFGSTRGIKQLNADLK